MLPLLRRDPQSLIAGEFNRQKPGPDPLDITAASFVSQVEALSRRLPDHAYVFNLCQNRLLFFYGLTSVATAGQCNLLPPNRQPGTIESLHGDYPDSYILHDGEMQTVGDIPMVDIRDLTGKDSHAKVRQPVTIDVPMITPMIPGDQAAAISFTSGSTGQSRPNVKTWSMLLDGAEINARNMLIGAPAGLNILATVPSQHMYGLELTITLPLVADVRMYSGQPLYPDDVLDALNSISAPRALVTTPQHLRALVASNLEYPEVERVFSATAPLDATLAEKVEKLFKAQIVEIYGCSEIGSVARRRTATESAWTPFTAMTFRTTEGITQVGAPHVPEPVELQDHIDINPDGSFELKGRLGDLINIAGKRGSLAQLNQLLLSIPGVLDGVIFSPAEADGADRQSTTRLAAMVVTEQVDKQTILSHLRNHVDPVFLPRPLLFVESLPRNETSKLPRKAVLEMFSRISNRT